MSEQKRVAGPRKKTIGLAAASLTSFILLPNLAVACRTDMPTHRSRMERSETAFVARVSGISLPDLERLEYDDAQSGHLISWMPLKVRLVPTSQLKGEAPKLLEIKISRCEGSGYVKIGKELNVYMIDGQWRVNIPEPLLVDQEVK